MSAAGFVLIHRSLLGHTAFRNDGEAMAFAWLIAKAAWKPTRVRYKSHSIDLDRGDLAVSVRDLAEALDRPKGWVERLLSGLKAESMIKTRAETGVTVITICNYEAFQADRDQPRTPVGTADRNANFQDSNRTVNGTPRETARETVDDSATSYNHDEKPNFVEGGETVDGTAGETRPSRKQDTEQIREQKNKFSIAHTPTREQPPSELEQRCRTIAGLARLIRPISPQDREVMRGWLRDGLHFDFHIVEGVKVVVAREEGRGRGISGFKYLDGGVRDYHADWVRENERLRMVASGGNSI